MNHLNDLLDDISADGPVDDLDLHAVIGAGRSRVRRRRAVAGVAGAAVLGLAAVVVLPGVGSEPGPATAQVRVLTFDDATPADPGRDYRVLAEYTARATGDTTISDFVRGVLPDGTVVAARYPNGPDQPTVIALLGPERTRTVEAPIDLVNYLGATAGELVFGSQERGLWLLSIADLQWRHILEETDVSPNHTVQPLTGNDGHIYVAGAAFDDEEVRTIYDVDLATGQATELVRGGDVAASGGTVAWTDAYGAPVQTVTLQDEAGGTSSFDTHTGDCVGVGLGITDQRVVLMTNCNEGAGDDESNDEITRVDVFDLEGNPVARITGDDMGPARMADRYLTLTSFAGEHEGSYTYDLETERFLRVTEKMTGLSGNETGVGSTVVWEEQLVGESGARYIVAEMR